MTIQKYNKAKMLGGGRILTPWFRAAFANVFQVYQHKNSDKPGKYEITPLFDEKSVDITPLKAAVYEAAKEKFGKKIPPSSTYELPAWCHSPFHAGEEKPDYDGYEGMTYFCATSNFKPQVLDGDRVEIGAMDQPGLYSGCFARATVSAWAYDNPQRKGVGFNIHNVQKLADGTPFGASQVDATAEFDAANDFEGPDDFNFGSNADGGDQESWM